MNFDRRTLLGGLSATGATLMLDQSAAGTARKPFFTRVGLPIGLQLYTLGEDPTKDLDGTLAKVVAIGYREIQLPSLFGKAPGAIRAAADKAGLAITSLHLGPASMVPAGGLSLGSAPAQIAEALGALGTKSVVLPIAPFPAKFQPLAGETIQTSIARAFNAAGPDLWKRTAAMLNERAAALKPLGITLSYHNHNIEFAPVGATTGWKILTSEADRGLVFFEVDIGWVSAAGLDPIAFLKSINGRVRQLHVKDVQPTTVANFGLSMAPTEVGSGRIDWARVLPAAYAAGTRHFYVEQEAPFTMPRIDASAKSYRYLSKLVA